MPPFLLSIFSGYFKYIMIIVAIAAMLASAYWYVHEKDVTIALQRQTIQDDAVVANQLKQNIITQQTAIASLQQTIAQKEREQVILNDLNTSLRLSQQKTVADLNVANKKIEEHNLSTMKQGANRELLLKHINASVDRQIKELK